MESGYIGLSLMQPNTHCRDGIGETRQERWGRAEERGEKKDGVGGEGCMGRGGGGKRK